MMKVLQSPLQKDLMIKQYSNISFIPLEEILFIERVNRKAVIHTFDEKIQSNESLTNLESKLDTRFFTSHRSFIINLQYLTRIEVVGQMYKAHFKNYEETAKISKHRILELQKYKSL